MKRVFKKAVAFISAVAVAASMAISASAESAGKRIVANAGYKQVIATDSGVFFTNFSDEEIQAGSASKTVLCVTPDGNKKKVKLKNSTKVTSCNLINSRSVYYDSYYANHMSVGYYDKSAGTSYQLIFTNGKTVNVSSDAIYSYFEYGKYALVVDSINRENGTSYDTSKYSLYDGNGKAVVSVPYSALKGASGGYIELAAFDSDTKSALFVGDYNPDTGKRTCWLVRNNKTVKTFKGVDGDFVKNSKGETVVSIVQDYDTYKRVYYSAKTGKKISKFVEQNDTQVKNYTVELSGTKYNVLNKSGKKLYSIDKSKVAGYRIYDESVAIITKSGSKYGLILVK